MTRGIAMEWTMAVNYGSMEEFDIPDVITDRRPDGSVFITAENTMRVRR